MPSRVENETEHVCMCVWGGEEKRDTCGRKREKEGERVRGRERERVGEIGGGGRSWQVKADRRVPLSSA